MLGLLVTNPQMLKRYRHRWIVCFQKEASQRVVIRSFVLKYDARQAARRYREQAPQGSAVIVDSRNAVAMKSLGLS